MLCDCVRAFREFARLKGELEAVQGELATAREELAAVTFTQESKVGRQLMAKCRSLQVGGIGGLWLMGRGHQSFASASIAGMRVAFVLGGRNVASAMQERVGLLEC